ncbi:hypothetical protein NH8B_2872 [Pseudogulbenkiania sp. NH8B]|nr:hypothetical protein NH8B_2872 [Pseudogulbenkiania sp. NH8B]
MLAFCISGRCLPAQPLRARLRGDTIPIASWFFPSERHDRLTGNPTVRDKRLGVPLVRRRP